MSQAPPGSRLDALEKLLKQGQDSALLRFGLGRAYLEAGRIQEAVVHLEAAVTLDPGYSAAWKAVRTGFGPERPDRGGGWGLRTRDHDRRGPRRLASGKGDGGISEAVAARGGEKRADVGRV